MKTETDTLVAGKDQANEAPTTTIDTSKMSRGQREALEMTEAARDTSTQSGSFAADLFMGNWRKNKLFPFPTQTKLDEKAGKPFLDGLKTFVDQKVDPDEIDRSGEIPDEVIRGLGDMGAFAIKVPQEYGGLGLSQTNYCKAAMVLGAQCGNLTALVSAHQSIGVPQPLILFGTDEQKERYLPRFAKGEISAFALTEKNVGSDPARMETYAEPTADGEHFILNGEKVWCTNSLKASVIVVMARTPDPRGGNRKKITAFIVEMDSPGVEIIQRCRFMGLRALYNGVVRFENVKVPRENIILGEGRGLKVALTTLNTGRLTLPAACVGMMRSCLQFTTRWCSERKQWGCAIGQHDAIAGKVARMAADTYAMESITLYTAAQVDRDKKADIRLEAAMSKMWGTESAWYHANETLQIKGGRGYETAQSLKQRGEAPDPIERLLRDCRINTIFEGSSEIMRLFIMREALDPHLKVGAAVLNTQLPWSVRIKAAIQAGLFYSVWLPAQFIPRLSVCPPGTDRRLRKHFWYAERTSRRLARNLFFQMVKYGPQLERKQRLLARFADIATQLFVLATSAARANEELKSKKAGDELIPIIDEIAANTRETVEDNFTRIYKNHDRPSYQLAKRILKEVK
ncbi:MAG: acyl-CoA dehydrogenase family protein [Verrucomicrobiota bacterium]